MDKIMEKVNFRIAKGDNQYDNAVIYLKDIVINLFTGKYSRDREF